MNKFLLLSLAVILIFSCRSKNRQDTTIASKVEMMEADRAFSLMSKDRGLRNAYIEFIDSSGVLLRPGNLPITGGDAMDYITQGNDSSYMMTWEPKDASIAASGEMGYTYGVYSIRPKEADTVYYGSYVTIWKKQANGKWKFTLQSGNEGVEP